MLNKEVKKNGREQAMELLLRSLCYHAGQGPPTFSPHHTVFQLHWDIICDKTTGYKNVVKKMY